MDWQQVASLSIVVITAILLVRHEIMRRRRANTRACGSDCDCASAGGVERLKKHILPEYEQKTVTGK